MYIPLPLNQLVSRFMRIYSGLMQLEDTRPTQVESAVPIIAAKDVWEEAETSDSYRSPATSHGYASALELSLRQPQPLTEQSAHLIDLESDAIEQEAGESLLHVSSNELNAILSYRTTGLSSLCSYTDQGHCGLLPPFIKYHKMSQHQPQEHTNQ